MVKIPLKNGTLHHAVTGKHGATTVFMQPVRKVPVSSPAARCAPCSMLWVKNVSAKCHGSTNPVQHRSRHLDGLSKMYTRATSLPSAARPWRKSWEWKNERQETVKGTLVKSLIGRIESHKACARGLKKIRQSVEVIDTPENRGMINKISYLLKCEG